MLHNYLFSSMLEVSANKCCTLCNVLWKCNLWLLGNYQPVINYIGKEPSTKGHQWPKSTCITITCITITSTIASLVYLLMCVDYVVCYIIGLLPLPSNESWLRGVVELDLICYQVHNSTVFSCISNNYYLHEHYNWSSNNLSLCRKMQRNAATIPTLM